MEVVLDKKKLDVSLDAGLLSGFKVNPWGMLDHLGRTFSTTDKPGHDPLFINYGGLSNLKASKEQKQLYRQIHPYIIASHTDIPEKAAFRLHLHRDGSGILSKAVIQTK